MGKYKYITNLAGGLFVLTIVSGLILSSPLASADNSATNNIRITVPISCNLSSTSNTAHTATIDAGTYRNDIGESTITATCNDAGGFAIYAIGYSNDTHGNNTLINTTNESQTIATGTATSGATSNWAMKLTSVEGTYTPTIENGFGSYSTVPETNTKVASHASVTDQTNGASFKSTYAAYIAPTQYAGTYEGKVKYTLVHPNVSGDETEPTAVIIYNPNATDVRGTMNLQYVSGETVLDAPNYARSGYGFAGWNTQADGNGINLGPNQTIDLEDYASLIDEDNNSLTLYAKWIAAEQNVTMQTFDDTLEPYASVAEDTVIALEDERDHDVYAVAKLADGNWWMIENLRLDPSAVTFTADNTNNPYVDANDTSKSFASLAANSSSSSDWCSTSNADCDNQVVFNTGNLTDSNRAYGVYYNWFTATAGNGVYDSSTFNAKTEGDICPKSWHLPEGGDKENYDYSNLWNFSRAVIGADPVNYSDTSTPGWAGDSEGVNSSFAIRSYPNNLLYSGRQVGGASNSYHGVRGYYWSSTISNIRYIFGFSFADNSVQPSFAGGAKYHGLTVRCLAD